MTGYCECGCGLLTRKFGRGQSRRFIRGHNHRGAGPTENGNGYLKTWNAQQKRFVFVHVAMAEKALGKPLPVGAMVHHVDGNPANNDPTNLVICQNQAYHLLLHRRTRSLVETGRPDLPRCRYCGHHDYAENMYTRSKDGIITHSWHRKCHTKYMRKWRSN